MVKLIEAIDLAIDQAKKSSGPFKHGCVIMSGKNIVSKGNNHIRTKVGTLSIHAEMDAIWKMDSDQYSNKKAVIVRLSNGGTKLSNSRPCSICMGLLKQHGINTIAYSTASGKIQLEQIL
jgi:tRNA(Arg) A34 adenosine deaminase TadA